VIEVGVIVRQKEKGGPWWVFVNHQGKRQSKLVGDKPTAEAVDRLDDESNMNIFHDNETINNATKTICRSPRQNTFL
jgi:hypothetical protein